MPSPGARRPSRQVAASSSATIEYVMAGPYAASRTVPTAVRCRTATRPPGRLRESHRHHAGGAIGRVGAGAVAERGARQDRPRRAGQRRPSSPRVGRRRGRGLPGGRARRARAHPRAVRPAAHRGNRPRARRRRDPGLRLAVRAAHRPPRPRAQRLLRAPAPRHAARRAGGARRARDHPVGRPDVRLRRGRPQAPRVDLERPPAGPRHLLRRPADGARARRRRHAGRPQREYGPATRPDHPRRRPVRRASTASSPSG